MSPEWPKPQRAESRLSEEKTRDSLVTRRTHSDPTERVPTTGGDAAEALDALPLLVVSCVCLDLVFTCTLAKFIYRYSPLFSFFCAYKSYQKKHRGESEGSKRLRKAEAEVLKR